MSTALSESEPVVVFGNPLFGGMTQDVLSFRRLGTDPPCFEVSFLGVVLGVALSDNGFWIWEEQK